MNEEDKLRDIEKKVKDFLEKGIENEYSNEIRSINKLISSPFSHKRELPSFGDLLKEYPEINKPKVVSIRYGIFLKAAAILLLVGSLALVYIGTNLPSNAPVAKIIEQTGNWNSNLQSSSKTKDFSITLGERVSTKAQSKLVLETETGNRIELNENSDLFVQSLPQKKANVTSIELLKGKLNCYVHKLDSTSKFIVSTPHSIVEVRGTKFSVEVKENLTNVIVTEGLVAVTSKKSFGPEIVLGPNEEVKEIKDYMFEKNLSKQVSVLENKTSNPVATKITDKKKIEKQSHLTSKEVEFLERHKRIEILTLKTGKKISGIITYMDDSNVHLLTTEGQQVLEKKLIQKQDLIKK